MRTIEEIRKHVKSNRDSLTWGQRRSFKYVIQHLDDNEQILVAFDGVWGDRMSTKGGKLSRSDGTLTGSNRSWAVFAFTNQRLIYGRRRGLLSTIFMAGSFIKTVELGQIKKVSAYKRVFFGTIVLETFTNTIKVSKRRRLAQTYAELIRRAISTQNSGMSNENDFTSVRGLGIAEEIKALKELEIEGIISKEEFEAKKRKLMGLDKNNM